MVGVGGDTETGGGGWVNLPAGLTIPTQRPRDRERGGQGWVGCIRRSRVPGDQVTY